MLVHDVLLVLSVIILNKIRTTHLRVMKIRAPANSLFKKIILPASEVPFLIDGANTGNANASKCGKVSEAATSEYETAVF